MFWKRYYCDNVLLQFTSAWFLQFYNLFLWATPAETLD